MAAFSSRDSVLEVAPARLAANLLCASCDPLGTAGLDWREEDVDVDVENVRKLAALLSEMAAWREDEETLEDEGELKGEDGAGIGDIARASAFGAGFLSLGFGAGEAGPGAGGLPDA